MSIRFIPKSIYGRITLIFALLFLGFIILTFLEFSRFYHGAYKKALDVGLLVSIDDLIPEEIPAKQNASIPLKKFKDWYEEINLFENKTFKEAQKIVESLDQIPNQYELNTIQKTVQDLSSLYTLIDEASRLPHARFEVDYKNISVHEVQSPNYLTRLHMIMLMKMRVIHLASAMDYESAYQELYKMFHLSKFMFEESPSSISFLIGLSLTDHTLDTAHFLLNLQSPPLEIEKQLVKTLHSFKWEDWLKTSLQFETLGFIESWNLFIRGEISTLDFEDRSELPVFMLRYPFRFIIRANEAYFLSQMTRMYQNISQPYHLFSMMEYSNIPSWAYYADRAFKNFSDLAFRSHGISVKSDLLILSFDIQRFHASHGFYPDNLNQLNVTYFNQQPIDPFCGLTYRYKLSEKGCMVYSVGKNRKDDNGRPSNSNETYMDEGDIIWKLY